MHGAMPKSRGRKNKKQRAKSTRTKQQLATRSTTARLQADLHLLRATDEAEARGDARGALDLILRDVRLRHDANFWRPEKTTRLMQLAYLGPLLPRWATSRWILAQAAQWLDETSRSRVEAAMAVAILVGGSGRGEDVDELDLRAKTLDHDWAFRQALLYDFGGLRHYLERVASPDLVAGADRIRDWAETPLGGYQLLRETASRLTWFDLREGVEVETVNLGAAGMLTPGEHVLGRLVPVDGGRMFETAPLFVPDRVARQVADAPAEWVEALASIGFEDGYDGRPLETTGHDFPLLTDAPVMIQQLMMIEVEESVYGHALDTSSLDLADIQLRFVLAAVQDRLRDEMFGASTWPVVAAFLLEPSMFLRFVRRPRPGAPGDWRRLAERLAGPASRLCSDLANLEDSAA